MIPRILIVEDETDLRELIVLHVKRAQFQVDEASNGQEALQKLKERAYDLVVLDWMLPKLNGIEIVRILRDQELKTALPILMLTAKATDADVVFALEAGVDDYITKPFEPTVLIARVRALLRRSQPQREEANGDNQKLQFGELSINPDAFTVSYKNEVISLTPSEFKLLHALALNRGRVLTRDRLIELVQGNGVAVIDRAIDTHVFGLRKKLGDASHFIETVRGIGYRIHFEG